VAVAVVEPGVPLAAAALEGIYIFKMLIFQLVL
jgi:hypothetical protein